VDVFIFQQ